MRYTFKKEELRPVMSGHLKFSGNNPDGERIEANNLYVKRNGKPWIPVMGEYQFARANRHEWRKELAKIKAGGITIVSTYIIWLYHEEIEGFLNFEGDNDLREFVLACQDTGLDVLLRIGPWIHGECRNGGFPDWLMKKSYPLRTNNSEYLAQVKRWYSRISQEVEGLLYKDGGNIVGVQIENELQYDKEHLATLKEMAIECGIDVPIYTITGWAAVPAGAQMPQDEFLPVFAGYCEAPWRHNLNSPIEPSPHYFFTGIRNDPAVGSDLSLKPTEDGGRFLEERYPFVTCELGGGVPMSHHRRVIVNPMDIYALVFTTIGDGNNLPGYYIYHGSTNKLGKLSTFQESIASGYPNDYPVLNYDFQAPLSEYGEARGHYGLLNLLNLFVSDFQEELAVTQRVAPLHSPSRDDVSMLRYAMRTDGESGFVFVNHYQRLTKLEDLEEVQLDTGKVVFPPISVKGESAFLFPFNLKMEKEILEYATAQPICRLDNTYFFVEIPGIEAVYQFKDNANIKVKAGKDSVFTKGSIQVVTLLWEEARFLRKLSDGNIYLGEGCDVYLYRDKLFCIQNGRHSCYRWEGHGFIEMIVGEPEVPVNVIFEETSVAPFNPPYIEELQIGGSRNLRWKKIIVDSPQGFVSIDDKYDVAQIYADEQLIADNFYYGITWRVPAKLLYGKECYLVMSELKDDFYREF